MVATRRIQALPSLALIAVFGAGALAVTVGERPVPGPAAGHTASAFVRCPSLADWNTMVPDGTCPAQS